MSLSLELSRQKDKQTILLSALFGFVFIAAGQQQISLTNVCQ